MSKEKILRVRRDWSRQELLLAFRLYCRIPFGKLHSRNPEIVKYAELIERTPSALAMKLTNIASRDPAITSTGRKGLARASAADKKMWEEMQNDWEGFAMASEQAMNSIMRGHDSYSSSTDIELDDDYTGLEKIVHSKVRIGQNFFRESVLSAYNYKCCITGLSIPSLLVASHIVPWMCDAENRLNPRNGLALSMLHDKAFDIGIITINEDMTIRVSGNKKFANDEFYVLALKNYEGKTIALPEKFTPRMEFLSYHRENIFKED